MSNSPLDDISYKLGEVSAGLANLASKFEKQDQTLTNLNESVGEITAHIKPIADDVKWMKPQVHSYQKVRRTAIWVGSMAVTVFGAVGGFVSDWAFKKYLG